MGKISVARQLEFVVSQLSARVLYLHLKHGHISVPLAARRPALPLLLKNSREYFPERAKCRGIQPRSSMMWAMWSTEERGMGREGKGRKNIKVKLKRGLNKIRERKKGIRQLIQRGKM